MPEVMMTHPKHGDMKVYTDDERRVAEGRGWEVKQKPVPPVALPVPPVDLIDPQDTHDEREALIAEALERGIEIDGRWGIRRLRLALGYPGE